MVHFCAATARTRPLSSPLLGLAWLGLRGINSPHGVLAGLIFELRFQHRGAASVQGGGKGGYEGLRLAQCVGFQAWCGW